MRSRRVSQSRSCAGDLASTTIARRGSCADNPCPDEATPAIKEITTHVAQAAFRIVMWSPDKPLLLRPDHYSAPRRGDGLQLQRLEAANEESTPNFQNPTPQKTCWELEIGNWELRITKRRPLSNSDLCVVTAGESAGNRGRRCTRRTLRNRSSTTAAPFRPAAASQGDAPHRGRRARQTRTRAS